MAEIVDTLETTAAEEKAGFSAQTIDYPEKYELPLFGGESKIRHERAVALVIDDANRFRRRKADAGYVHEVLTETGWTIQTNFDSLDEVLSQPIYLDWKRANPDSHPEVCCEPEPDGDDVE
jgi:hypothetical protein